jgi:hypothetical protein
MDEQPSKVYMVCTDDQTSVDVGKLLKRVSSAMSAIDSFHDRMCELDEDSPNLENQVSPLLERLTLTLMSIYPNPAQMQADIKSIGDFTVRKIEINGQK